MSRPNRQPASDAGAPAPEPTTNAPAGTGRARWLLAGASAALVAVWIGDVLGIPGAHPVAPVAAPSLLLLTIGLGAVLVTRALRRRFDDPQRRDATLAALAVLAFALLVRLTGVAHEVTQRAYLDEGTYYQHATDINDGQLLQRSFVYPHLLYYADAFTLWLADRLPGAESLAAWWTGSDDPIAHAWLTLRLVVALSSAATSLAVFALAAAIAGPLAATASGLLFVLSPLFNEGSHLIISDYPAACLATASLAFAGRLARRESTRDYVLAALFAGLAAGTKYPAGTVAVALVGVWTAHRIAERRIRWRSLEPLAIATGVAMVSFVATMPSLFVYLRHALTGPRGMLFGFRQYSGGGWIGVMRDNNLVYYGRELAGTFGVAALALAVLAPILLENPARRRAVRLLAFPIAYLALITVMNMVVKRNLAPVVPALCAFAGCGLAGAVVRLRRTARPGPVLAAGLALLAFAQPLVATAQDAASHARSSTREQAARWLVAHLPRGASVLRESYGPNLPPGRFRERRARFAARLPLREIGGGDYDVLILASAAYGRFLRQERRTTESHERFAERYDAMFTRFPPLAEFAPGPTRRGPKISILDLPDLAARPEWHLTAADAWVSDPAMLSAPPAGSTDPGSVFFRARGQWCTFRVSVPAGHYRLRWVEEPIVGEALPAVPPTAHLSTRPVTGDSRVGPDSRLELAADQWGGIDLTAGTHVIDLAPPPNTRLRGVELVGDAGGVH